MSHFTYMFKCVVCIMNLRLLFIIFIYFVICAFVSYTNYYYCYAYYHVYRFCYHGTPSSGGFKGRGAPPVGLSKFLSVSRLFRSLCAFAINDDIVFQSRSPFKMFGSATGALQFIDNGDVERGDIITVHVAYCVRLGATENARPDIARPSKLWRLTSRDWTTRHHIARVDSARLVSLCE